MHDSGKIILGIIVFLIIATIPFTYNIIADTDTSGAPEIEILPQAGDKCVRSKDYMKPYHMDLLNEWRDTVVREGNRFTEGPHGNQIEMSLSNTCMDCHSNRENFCDRCHNYMAVDPYCWDCHLTPSETAQPQMTALDEPKEGN
ncbi:MAG: sulfate reduction electron transfer complex DsrMKJOP subunit DsrJ [FCB group bacterium]|nr:sulfate reduction electron transfer complex DsrMKJOP subunit DsrJ [FCB group bacterium]